MSFLLDVEKCVRMVAHVMNVLRDVGAGGALKTRVACARRSDLGKRPSKPLLQVGFAATFDTARNATGMSTRSSTPPPRMRWATQPRLSGGRFFTGAVRLRAGRMANVIPFRRRGVDDTPPFHWDMGSRHTMKNTRCRFYCASSLP